MTFVDNRIGGSILQGVLPIRLTLSGPPSVKVGDVVHVDVSDGIKMAADDGADRRPRFVVGEDAGAGETFMAYRWALVGGRFEGVTPGEEIYVETGAGDPYTDSGNEFGPVGFGVTDTVCFIGLEV